MIQCFAMKDFFLRKLVKAKMGSLPEEQQEAVVRMFTQNPKLFKDIAHKAQEYMNKGDEQAVAIQKAVQEKEDELHSLLVKKDE